MTAAVILQLAAEGGLLVGIPAAIALAVFVITLYRRLGPDDEGRTDRWLRLGASMGLLAIAIQECADFSLQMPGNVVLFVVLSAIALRQPAAPEIAGGRTGRRSAEQRVEGK